MKTLTGKNNGHVQRTSDFGLNGIMVCWKKQERRTLRQLKNNVCLNEAGQEWKIQTEEKETMDMDPRINRTTDCVRQMIERN